MNRTCITIGRQYGSGGREIGKRLAERLELPFYDRELLLIAAEGSGIDLSVLEDFDEKHSDGLLYNFAMLANSLRDPEAGTLPHAIFQAECETIVWLARQRPCIFVGRCADYALKDVCPSLRVFLCASSFAERKRRVLEQDGIDPKNVEKYINRIDMQRNSYYNFFTGQEWGSMENYDLCLNSTTLGYDRCVDLIAHLWETNRTGE